LKSLVLDDVDLAILNLLARNGRLSYAKIANTIGLTTKSVKIRVDKMVKEKVINRFIVFVDPSILGYKITCTFAIRKHKLNQDILDKINLVGDIKYQFSVIGGVEGFSIGVRESSEDKLELLLESLKSSMLGVMVQTHSHPKISYKFIETDYQIIKQLLQNPRIEISEIAQIISISVKTVHRRLQKMQRNHMLQFTILPNPQAIKGQIVFYLEIKVEVSCYKAVFESIFNKLSNYLMLSLTHHHQEETIGLILASEDSFKIEFIRSQIESVYGVKEANIFFPIKMEYNQESIIKAVEQQMLRMVRKSD
jgi:DNA-binding Lrp family transcriptional regulator